mgnify:CR=1 FL=1
MRLGLPSILTIIFVIAKITGYVDWSWWLVFSPTFIGIGIGLILGIVAGVIEAINENKGRR